MRKLFIAMLSTVVLVAAAVPLTRASAQTPGVLDHVVILPGSANVTAGGSQQFSAAGEDADNVTIIGLSFTWEVVAGGGTISDTGLFTAANVTGTYPDTVKVTAAADNVSRVAYATVTVAAAAPPPAAPPGWTLGNKRGWQEQATPPGWSRGNKQGWQGRNMPPGLYKKSQGG